MEGDQDRGCRAARQTEVIAALRAQGADHVAERLGRCRSARTGRRRDAWPWRCRSPGCAWCGAPLARHWWRGLLEWAHEGGEMPLAARLPLSADQVGVVDAGRHLRRAVRDVRDRAARTDARWRCVAMAGLITAEGSGLVLIRHPGLRHAQVEAVMRRRWPSMSAACARVSEPSFLWQTRDAVLLGIARRGIEPVRIVVMPQRQTPAPDREAPLWWQDPMPLVF